MVEVIDKNGEGIFVNGKMMKNDFPTSTSMKKNANEMTKDEIHKEIMRAKHQINVLSNVLQIYKIEIENKTNSVKDLRLPKDIEKCNKIIAFYKKEINDYESKIDELEKYILSRQNDLMLKEDNVIC